MSQQHEASGAESSSQQARTRTLGPIPSQLDAEHSAAQAGQLDATQRPTARKSEGRAAARWDQSSKADTATGVGLRSASQASAPPLVH
jgi:hypothetical protein